MDLRCSPVSNTSNVTRSKLLYTLLCSRRREGKRLPGSRSPGGVRRDDRMMRSLLLAPTRWTGRVPASSTWAAHSSPGHCARCNLAKTPKNRHSLLHLSTALGWAARQNARCSSGSGCSFAAPAGVRGTEQSSSAAAIDQHKVRWSVAAGLESQALIPHSPARRPLTSPSCDCRAAVEAGSASRSRGALGLVAAAAAAAAASYGFAARPVARAEAPWQGEKGAPDVPVRLASLNLAGWLVAVLLPGSAAEQLPFAAAVALGGSAAAQLRRLLPVACILPSRCAACHPRPTANPCPTLHPSSRARPCAAGGQPVHAAGGEGGAASRGGALPVRGVPLLLQGQGIPGLLQGAVGCVRCVCVFVCVSVVVPLQPGWQAWKSPARTFRVAAKPACCQGGFVSPAARVPHAPSRALAVPLLLLPLLYRRYRTAAWRSTPSPRPRSSGATTKRCQWWWWTASSSTTAQQSSAGWRQRCGPRRPPAASSHPAAAAAAAAARRPRRAGWAACLAAAAAAARVAAAGRPCPPPLQRRRCGGAGWTTGLSRCAWVALAAGEWRCPGRGAG